MRIFLGIILCFVGFLIVWKTEPLISFTGLNSWAERHLGTEGGTRLLYKFIGIVVIFFGLLAITNLYNGFLEGTLGPLLGPSLG